MSVVVHEAPHEDRPAIPPSGPVVVGPETLNYIDDAAEFSPAVLAALATPVDPAVVEVRQPNDLLYVPWIHYQSVLVKAFGVGGFRMVPKRPSRQQGNVFTWEGSLWVRAPGEKKFQFVEEAIGECGIQSAGNGPEGAKSDCLTKCCKRLNIFMEMFDPAWRRAWESKYKATHLAAKGKRDWVGRDRAAPATPAPAPAGSSPAAKTGPAGSSAAPAAEPASTPPPEAAATPDTGEAASPEALEAIKGQLKRLGWKLGMMRIWFAERFGIETAQIDAVHILGRLTEMQAVTAHLLLSAHGKPLYNVLLADAQAKGQAK